MEFQQYIYGLGPTLFQHLLPREYWQNFFEMICVHEVRWPACTTNTL